MQIDIRLPYFPRPRITERILQAADSGLTNGLTMFAPRRLGKTWFVKYELLPAFENAGWVAIGIDLWLRSLDVATGMVELLENASRGPVSGWSVERVKLKLGSGGIGGEASFAPSSHTGLDARLEAVMDKLASKDQRVLIVFDEFQSLAKGRNADIVPALRAALQKHQSVLFPLFTGSSRGALNSMFKSAKAPFFQSATAVEFPPLERDFIADRVALLAERSPAHRPLNLDTDVFYERFQWLGRSPLFANELVLQSLMSLTDDFEGIYTAWLIARAENQGYAAQYVDLKPIQQAVLRVLAESNRDGSPALGVYGKESLAAMRAFLPGEVITPQKVQTALKTLARGQLIAEETGKGEYAVEDAAFRAYLLANVPLHG